MTLYRIRDWKKIYETHETAKLKSLRWVPIPNKQDGLTFRKIGQDQNGPSIFCAFILMVEIASKCPIRGQLSQDEKGEIPLSPDDMGIKTGFPGDLFEKSLPFLIQGKTSWIEAIETKEHIKNPPLIPGNKPALPGESPANLPLNEGTEGMERKKEYTEKELAARAAVLCNPFKKK